MVVWIIILSCLAALFLFVSILLFVKLANICVAFYDNVTVTELMEGFIYSIIEYLSSYTDEENLKQVIHNSVKILCNKYNADLSEKEINKFINDIYNEVKEKVVIK